MKLKLMTFNIRYDNPDDGKNAFPGRRDMIIEFLRREKPDLIGFQEIVHVIRHSLAEALREYSFLAIDLGEGYRNDVAVAFRHDRFDLLRFEQFWLSPTPEVPHSRFAGGSPFDRMASLVTLVERSERRALTLLNSHLDHISDGARERGAELLLARLTPYLDTPCFLTGDFNAPPDTCAARILSGNAALCDLTAPLGNAATYHGYGKTTESGRIDYILASRAVRALPGTLTVHTDERDGVYLSDHYPISVEVEI